MFGQNDSTRDLILLLQSQQLQRSYAQQLQWRDLVSKRRMSLKEIHLTTTSRKYKAHRLL